MPLNRAIDPAPPTAPATLPESASPDELFIVGDCDALYLSTGDIYEPWITVQTRTHTVTVEAGTGGTRPGVLRRFQVDGIRRRRISVETNDRDEVQLRVGGGTYGLPTEWQPLEPGDEVAITLVGDTAQDEVGISFGDWAGAVPLAEWDPNWDMVLTHVTVDPAPVKRQLRAGVGLTYEAGPVPELCNRLRDRADD